LSLLKGAEIDSAIQSIDGFRAFFLSDSDRFLQLFKEHDRHLHLSYEELWEIACAAGIRKKVNDEEYRTDAEAFFSFLASQRQALAEAAAAETSVIHVQFHG
jgi:hypothetical protein